MKKITILVLCLLVLISISGCRKEEGIPYSIEPFYYAMVDYASLGLA